MAGTKAGGKKASVTNKLRHGEDFYAKIGAKGGRNGTTGGFASMQPCNGLCNLSDILGYGHSLARCAGYKGGRKSRRVKKNV